MAGTNVAALDQLFGGKAGLLRAVALAGFDQLAEEFGRAGGAGPAERLTLIACAHRAFTRDHPQLYDLMVSVPVRASDARREGDLAGALACRDLVVEAVRSLLGGPEEHVYDAAVGLTAVLEGLAIKERQGLLGASPEECDRIWSSTVQTYLAGLVAGDSGRDGGSADRVHAVADPGAERA